MDDTNNSNSGSSSDSSSDSAPDSTSSSTPEVVSTEVANTVPAQPDSVNAEGSSPEAENYSSTNADTVSSEAVSTETVNTEPIGSENVSSQVMASDVEQPSQEQPSEEQHMDTANVASSSPAENPVDNSAAQNAGYGATSSTSVPPVAAEQQSGSGKKMPYDVKGKRVMVVGFGRTGVSLVKFLVRLGAEVTISDHKSKAELVEQLDSLGDLQINFDLGGHTPKMFVAQDLIILSPGISPNLKIFDYARSHNVKVTGEFEFAASYLEERVIAVTGTNGKSTTCRLIEEMLKKSGVSCWLGGNYGPPLTDYLLSDQKVKVVIAEVSSFQLEHLEKFDPPNIVFMNLAENHLDRYRSMEEYINAKRRVFFNVSQNTTSILNADDNAVVELARDPMVQRGRIFYFSRKPSLEPQIMNIGGAVCVNKEIRVRTGPEIEYFTVQNMKMRGRHSIENTMAAIISARDHGAKHEDIQYVIDCFPGMAHRLEYVRKVGGVQFFNDSKATNVHAVIRALDAFDENVILIMGGKDTNLNYEPLADLIRRKVKNLILVGEAKERINRYIGDDSETFLIGTFEEAILISYQKSRNGDKVLLSPGCSSFDLFDSYVERGNYFKDLVKQFR